MPITPIDTYIASFPPPVRAILKNIRRLIRQEAPNAEEILSYRMPAFRQGKILLYFAAFKKHIGIYPPIRGNAALTKAAAPYAGPKGNLQLPMDKPIPYPLLRRIIKHRLRQIALGNQAKTSSRQRKRPDSQ